MKNFIKYLRILGFVLLILLATFGVALPIPMFHRETQRFHIEQIDEVKD